MKPLPSYPAIRSITYWQLQQKAVAIRWQIERLRRCLPEEPEPPEQVLALLLQAQVSGLGLVEAELRLLREARKGTAYDTEQIKTEPALESGAKLEG